MGQSPTQLLSSTTFNPQRDVRGERLNASFSCPTDWMNHSPPSYPSTAVAQRRVNKEVVTRSGKRCSFCGGLFHPRYSCPARDATCFSCGKPGHFACVCQSNPGYKSAPSKAVLSHRSKNRILLALPLVSNLLWLTAY